MPVKGVALQELTRPLFRLSNSSPCFSYPSDVFDIRRRFTFAPTFQTHFQVN